MVSSTEVVGNDCRVMFYVLYPFMFSDSNLNRNGIVVSAVAMQTTSRQELMSRNR